MWPENIELMYKNKFVKNWEKINVCKKSKSFDQYYLIWKREALVIEQMEGGRKGEGWDKNLRGRGTYFKDRTDIV
jgi:hypothetical protein